MYGDNRAHPRLTTKFQFQHRNPLSVASGRKLKITCDVITAPLRANGPRSCYTFDKAPHLAIASPLSLLLYQIFPLAIPTYPLPTR
jgi:hypothetical protein